MKLRKTTATLLIAIFMISMFTVSAIAKKDFATIQDGTIVDTKDNVITIGYDQWGYNYQAHLFRGYYDNAGRPDIPVTDGDTMLIMKWNDAWLSNKDCDDDNLLDRHYGFDSYIGSGAWCTNHQFGSYIGDDEQEYKWNWFIKIVAVPEYADLNEGIWYDAENNEIGPEIWGAFAIIQEVYNDQGTGDHGILYLSPVSAGLGCYK